MHADDGVPLVLAHADDEAVAQDPGVVYEHVQVAVVLDGLADHPLSALPVGGVVEVGDGAAAERDDLVDQLLGGGAVVAGSVGAAPDVVDDDARSLTSEEERVLAADAAPCAGDDRDSSVQRSHDYVSSFDRSGSKPAFTLGIKPRACRS